MRTITVTPPSFPSAPENTLLASASGARWEVLCGDEAHWRVGLYSPPETSRHQLAELERHDCPELFCLLEGRLTLVLVEAGEVRELPLEAGRAVLVTAPHNGYCPDGPHTGLTLVVERDRFTTEYRSIEAWLRDPP